MNLRHLSRMVPDRDRLQIPRSGGKNLQSKNLVMFNRDRVPSNWEPIRLTPKTSSSVNGRTMTATTASVRVVKPSAGHDLPGPSRQLIPTSPTPILETSDGLDGITVLPPSASIRDRVLRSSSKKEGSSHLPSRIPRNSGLKTVVSMATERKSLVVAKKKLHLSNNRRKETGATHPRIRAILDRSPSTSRRSSADSTAQFEADELAAQMPTPAPTRPQIFRAQQPNSAEALEEMKKLQQKLSLSHAEFLVKQRENFDKQNGFLQKQTQTLEKQNMLIEKQTEVLCNLNTLLEKNIKFFNNHMVSNESDSSGEEKENETLNRSKIGRRAANQYNDIRAGFNFLSLKKPGKGHEGSSPVTPKTPKSILSRTLQMQLGDIFEES